MKSFTSLLSATPIMKLRRQCTGVDIQQLRPHPVLLLDAISAVVKQAQLVQVFLWDNVRHRLAVDAEPDGLLLQQRRQVRGFALLFHGCQIVAYILCA